jgi:hypothetical protein
MEFIAKDPMFEDNELVQDQFGTLLRAMLSLFQIMTFDSWSAIVRPIIDKDAKTVIIFFLFMGLSSIVLFNLMTAIVVTNAFDAAAADKEAVARVKAIQEVKTKGELIEMFEDLDEDRSGCLSKEEFFECMDDLTFVRKLKLLDIELEELPDIFEILDDGDGQVDQTEFINGMLKLQGPAMSAEMLKATCHMRTQNVHFTDLEDNFIMNAMEIFRNVDGHVDHLHQNMNDMMALTAEIVGQLDLAGITKVVGGSASQLPFLEDPDVDEMVKVEKAKQKKKKRLEKERKKAELHADLDKLKDLDKQELALRSELYEQKSFVASTVPQDWVVRNGKSPLQQNPGKLRLNRDPQLKDRLMGRRKKEVAKKVNGVHVGFHKAWETLDLPLDRDGLLDKQILHENYGSLPPPPPVVANGLSPWFMPPTEQPAEAVDRTTDPLAKLGLEAPAQEPPSSSDPAGMAVAASPTPQAQDPAPTEPPAPVAEVSLTSQVQGPNPEQPPSHPHAVP